MNEKEVTKLATKIVDAIFADIRDRRFIKWLFTAGDVHAVDRTELPWLKVELRYIDRSVQNEIRSAWIKIVAARLSPDQQVKDG